MTSEQSSTFWILGGVGLLALIVLMMSRNTTTANPPTSPTVTQTTDAANHPSAPVATNTLAYDIGALPSPTLMSQSDLSTWLLGEQHLSAHPIIYNGAATA